MVKFKKLFYYFVLILCCLTYIGCEHKEMKVNFVRFDIGYRETAEDYYLDFTLKFDNQTKNEILINNYDFKVIVNEQIFNNVSFWYETENVYYAKPTIKANEILNLRVRVIANINDKSQNYISISYKDKLIIEDNITINNMNN